MLMRVAQIPLDEVLGNAWKSSNTILDKFRKEIAARLYSLENPPHAAGTTSMSMSLNSTTMA